MVNHASTRTTQFDDPRQTYAPDRPRRIKALGTVQNS
jgi:hypothetical protein